MMLIQEKQRPSSTTLKHRIESFDWSFLDRQRGHEIESIHPYPAKFVAEIPRAFLSALPLPPGTSVLDPFCGSGTTLTEAQRSGHSSVGLDLNPIACLISRVKTAPTPSGLDLAVGLITETARANRKPVRWAIPNVDHWFKTDIQTAIAALIQAIREHAPADCVDALSLALSSVLVRVSNQESDTRYAAIEKNVASSDVFRLFLIACTKLCRALDARNWQLAPARVIEGDTLMITPEAIGLPIGMVITSPPYPNAYEYWLYHKYRMWWLGFNPLTVKEQEIGARAHFFKRDHHTEEHFWAQMRLTFNLIDAVLVKAGFACFLIGRSKIHGQVIENAAIIRAVSQEKGMRLITEFKRVISPQHKSFNLSHANIKAETVLVFQKE